jgi:hypothetical protein
MTLMELPVDARETQGPGPNGCNEFRITITPQAQTPLALIDSCQP